MRSIQEVNMLATALERQIVSMESDDVSMNTVVGAQEKLRTLKIRLDTLKRIQESYLVWQWLVVEDIPNNRVLDPLP